MVLSLLYSSSFVDDAQCDVYQTMIADTAYTHAIDLHCCAVLSSDALLLSDGCV